MLVDVRHEASHNELPSLALLRVAAAEALRWLEASYWQRQADHLVSCRARISELLGVNCLCSCARLFKTPLGPCTSCAAFSSCQGHCATASLCSGAF